MFHNLIRQTPTNRPNHFPPIFPWLLIFMNWLLANGMATKAKEPECSDDADCEKIWPHSNCGLRNRCQCAANELRRQSPTRGWVCLTLLDAVSSSIGPPATCPLPAGAGYATIERDKNGRPVFCRIQSTKASSAEEEEANNGQCGPGYECIRAAGQFSDQWDGVCCPMAKELVCRTLPAGNGLNGRLPRFWWNGTECLHFLWAPEDTHKTRCANTFTTKEQCLSFCGTNDQNSR